MIIRLIIFITTFLAVIAGAHYALYVSTVRFLYLTSSVIRTYFIIALAVLGISFFVSAFLIRLHVNFITNIYYAISGFWLGLLVNLLLACAVLWIAFGVLKLAGAEPKMLISAITLFSLAVLVSFYGTWNAFHPQPKNIDITIKNLPPQWKGKKIVQLSDMHLGPVHRVGFLKKVVEITNAEKPDLILITGDLFDGMDGKLEPFINPLNQFKAKNGVYFVTGNHEGYLGLNSALDILSKTDIKLLDDEVVDINGLQLVGVSYPLFDQPNHPEDVFALKSYDPKKPTVLMYHTPTNVAHKNTSLSQQQWSAYWGPDTDFTFAEKNGVNLQLSGHVHKGQIFPFSLVARLIYGKYYYGLNADGKFQIYTAAGVGTWGPPMRTFCRAEVPVITLK